MSITVTGPDNITVSFPDGTNASVINDVMTKHFGGGASKPSSPVTATGLARAAGEGIPVVGGLLNKANAATYAGLAPLFPGDTTVSHAPSFGERYSENLGRENEKSQQFETEHPIASTAAGIAGGVGATLPLAATGLGARALGLTGRTLPAQMMQGAASGAAINAADALTRGNDIGMAAGIGGAIGAGSPAVARAIGGAVSPVVGAVRGIINPNAEAMQRVGGAIARDTQAGAQGLTQPQFTQAAAQGAPVNLMDLGGETTRALARSAANTSPEGRQILNQAIDNRFEGQSDRLSNWLNSTFNYPNADLRQQALERSQSVTDNHNYARAMSEGSRGIWNPDLERLASSDIVANAMKKAASVTRDESVIGGYAGMNPNVSFTPDGRIQFARGPGGVPVYPDLQFWDLTRRQLSNSAQMMLQRGDNEEARRFGIFAQRLNSALDREVPSYQAARAGHEAFENAQDALEAGRNYATRARIDNRSAQAAIMRMNTTERQLFQDGFVDSLVQRVRSVPDRQNVVAKIANSRAAQEQMQIALGPQRANELQAMLHIENIMDAARGAVQGNSTTARQLAELGLAGGASMTLGGGNPLSGDPQALMNAALMYSAVRGAGMARTAVNERVAAQVARLLTSNDPAQIRLAMNTIGRNQAFLNGLRRTDAALARAAAVQAQPDQRKQ